MKKIIVFLIIGFFILLTCGCSKNTCPTYASAHRAKKQMNFEKKGGHTSNCIYIPDITKKEKKRANQIWESDFCKPPKPRKSKF